MDGKRETPGAAGRLGKSLAHLLRPLEVQQQPADGFHVLGRELHGLARVLQPGSNLIGERLAELDFPRLELGGEVAHCDDHCGISHAASVAESASNNLLEYSGFRPAMDRRKSRGAGKELDVSEDKSLPRFVFIVVDQTLLPLFNKGL